MAIRPLPDVAYLRECLDYDPQSGEFIWRPRPREHFQSVNVWKVWNARFSGKAAGTVGPHGYRVICVANVMFKAHRLAWLLERGGPIPPMLDHRDGDPSNNRIENLRVATLSDNAANKRTHANSRTGIKGVSILGGRFRAVIRRHGVRIHIGLFDTLDEAAAARHEAAERLHGEFARDS